MLKAAWAGLEGFPPGVSLPFPAWIPASLIDAALTPAEAARAQGFHRPERRRQYLIGHALLRLVAGAVLGIDPERISLPAEGRPCLHSGGATKPLWLSLAHSGPYVAAIASDEGPVGVDVERTDQER